MAYILKILSPTHIHSGEVIRAMNYMIEDDKVLIFDELDVISSVKYNELLNDDLLRNFAASDSKRKEYNKTLDYYINKNIVEDSVVEKYKLVADNYVGNLSGQEIYGTMVNILGSYIPGSTIKGVIRTAIIYDYLLNKGIDYIKEAVNYLYSKEGSCYTIDDYILYEVQENYGINKDIQRDPFKFLGVKDMNMTQNRLGIYQETIYNIDNFIPGNVIEAIEPGDYTEEFDFKIRVNEKVSHRFNEDIIRYFEEKELLRVLYQYSKDIIQDELEYFKQNKHPAFNSKEAIEILEELDSINNLDKPVLRIGKGKGYKSNTIALAIKKLDRDYYVREIKNIAIPYKYNKNYEFPKTRKFVNSAVSPKLLGFTILEKVDR